ncbi:DNA repair protein RecO [Nicoliella spurrieriana]|uniref:DNA repair protein RecO n=1 Tax=Nicoliella spurrieriana TaxID=2925830 RepID=A0A976RRL0_9LACO|nr:DNA repair protein RecO [Nicoliella spurrieriana]UQS86542.1 DNA repair protein RecO [Nicoliella spurrieriana]
MAIKKNVVFNGILLYRRNYRENDMLVKFFTNENGTKMFLIRRGRKQGFKMSADILPFTYGKYEGSISQDGLSYIKEPIETHHYQQISADILLNAYATYIMSLIDTALPEGVANHKWFNQLFYALELINHAIDPAVVTNIVEIQLLELFGVQPWLRDCVICHRNDLPLDYSAAYNGLICSQHWHMDPLRFGLSQRTVYWFRKFSVVELKKIRTIDLNQTTKTQLRKLLDSIYDDTVGIHPKSKRFLEEMSQNRF